jgi:DNA polymerase-3 subunit chi
MPSLPTISRSDGLSAVQVDFYHLTSMPLERALPRIAERVLESGARLLIVAGDDAQRAALGRLLWEYSSDSFLPHGCEGGEEDADQPILIAGDVNAANNAQHVALVDGNWRDDALDFDRAFHFFDEERIAEARAAWRSLGDRDNVERRYWKQNDAGRWEQAA